MSQSAPLPEKTVYMMEQLSEWHFGYAHRKYKVSKNHAGVARAIYIPDLHVILQRPAVDATCLQLVCGHVIQSMRLREYAQMSYPVDDSLLFKFDDQLYTVRYQAREDEMWIVLPDGRVIEPQWQSEALPSAWKQIENAKFIQHVGEQVVAEICER